VLPAPSDSMSKKIESSEATALPRIALVDANVFFAPRMRDLVMHLHAAEIINVHWTKEIEAEWTRNVVAKQGASSQDIQACLRGMRDAVDGWAVDGYSKHQSKFALVDPKDQHVAAAAYKLSLDDWPGQSVALITKNVKDFPHGAFKDTQVTLYPMSTYIDAIYAAEPNLVAKVAENCRTKLKNPPMTRESYVAVLLGHGCIGLAQGLSKLWSVHFPEVEAVGTVLNAPKTPVKKRTGKKATRK
jgi:hypothetical protein